MASPSLNAFRERLRKPALSFFIVFLVYLLMLCSFPAMPFFPIILHRLSPVINFLGLSQRQPFYYPDVRVFNGRLKAEIQRANGATELWELPRLNEFQKKGRVWRSRHNTWNREIAVNAGSWADTGRYIAILHANQGNPVKTVKVLEFWTVIPDPGKEQALPLPTGYPDEGSKVLFTYDAELDRLL